MLTEILSQCLVVRQKNEPSLNLTVLVQVQPRTTTSGTVYLGNR